MINVYRRFYIFVIADVLHEDATHIVVRLPVRERGPAQPDPRVCLRIEQPSPRPGVELPTRLADRAQ